MSAADEDTELRDLLIQTLDKNGVLGKIKAELRSSIFLALESQEEKTDNPITNKRLQKFTAGKDGKLCVGVVKQFLEHFSLDYSLAVFTPEVNFNESIPGDKEIADTLNMSADSPFLQQILTAARSERPASQGLDSKRHFLRSKFNTFDRAGSGAIDKSDVTTVITLACPFMKRDMVSAFVNDELKLQNDQKVSFDTFFGLFSKFYDMCTSVLNIGSQNKSNSSASSTANTPSAFRSNPPPHDKSSKKTELFSQNKSAEDRGISSAYLLPIGTPEKESQNYEGSHDPFFDSDMGGNLRTRPIDPMYTHIDTPAISPNSSKHEDETRSKRHGSNEESANQQYPDDFTSEHSITEDLEHDSFLSDPDFTEDKSVTDTPRGDYMEDVRRD